MPTVLTSATPTRALDEKQIADLLGMSLAWVRKDRRTNRRIPFFKLGDSVRYDWERVRQALLAREEGGHPGKTSALGAAA